MFVLRYPIDYNDSTFMILQIPSTQYAQVYGPDSILGDLPKSRECCR